MGEAKIRINLKEGTFEIEGSESFVEKYWEILKNSLEKLPPVPFNPTPSQFPQQKSSKPKSKINNKNKKSNALKESMNKIALDLKGNNDTPSLKKLYDEKSPKSNMEIVTLIAYYLKNHLNIHNMKYGHALFCFGEINKPKPINVAQLFTDTAFHHQWLEPSGEPYSSKITIAGENLIKHDLPHSKDIN